MIRTKSESSKDSFQKIRKEESIDKRTFLKVIAFASLGLAPVMNTCGISRSPGMTPETEKKRQPEDPGKNDSISRKARPPIDLAAPADTETATFALG